MNASWFVRQSAVIFDGLVADREHAHRRARRLRADGARRRTRRRRCCPPADDDDATTLRASAEDLAHDDLGRAAAGVLHEDDARHLARRWRARRRRASARARGPGSHALRLGAASRITTATATPASCVMLTCQVSAPNFSTIASRVALELEERAPARLRRTSTSCQPTPARAVERLRERLLRREAPGERRRRSRPERSARSASLQMRAKKRSPWRSSARASARWSRRRCRVPTIMGRPASSIAASIARTAPRQDEYRVRDHRVADVELDDLGDGDERGTFFVVRPCPAAISRPSSRPRFAAAASSERARAPSEGSGRSGDPIRTEDRPSERVRVLAGVELDLLDAERMRRLDLREIRRDEQAHLDVRVAQSARRASSARLGGAPSRPRARPRSSAPRAARARASRRPAPSSRDRDHLVGRRHLEVERRAQLSPRRRSTSASVMWRRSSRRWAVIPCAPASRHARAASHRVGVRRPACVTQRRDVIDVDVKPHDAPQRSIIPARFGRRRRFFTQLPRVAADTSGHGKFSRLLCRSAPS
jgi:hypothetical protein